MKNFLFAFFILGSLSSCASIFNSGSQTILATASNVEDEGTLVTVSHPGGTYNTKLPATIVTSPSTFEEVKITVKSKCYEETQVIVSKGITPSFWVNILIFPGLIVDVLDGYMWKYHSQVMVPTTRIKSCKK